VLVETLNHAQSVNQSIHTRTVQRLSTRQLELLRFPWEWRWLLCMYSMPLATSVMNDNLKLLSTFTSSFISMSCVSDAPFYTLHVRLYSARL